MYDGCFFDITNGGTFQLDNYKFSKMAIGCLLVGLGFGIPSIVYDNDKLPFAAQTIIHMGTGCLVYTIVAFTEGKILDDIEKAREEGKRPYQKVLLAAGSALLVVLIALIMSAIFKVLL